MFMTAIWKKSWNKDGADRRLHRIGGGGCRREIKVSFKAENPYTTFSTVSLQVHLTSPLERSRRAS